MSAAATLSAVERIIAEGGDADDILRQVVSTLHAQTPSSWVAISFVEDGDLVLGPSAGKRSGEIARFPIVYEGRTVGELELDAGVDRALIESTAAMLGPYCLVGWDTGGEAWSP